MKFFVLLFVYYFLLLMAIPCIDGHNESNLQNTEMSGIFRIG
jgi:hypothetical protein